jgi:acetyl esterase/lipase
MLKDLDLPMPACAVCLSPWLDLSLDTSHDAELGAVDPIASSDEMAQFASWYLPDTDLRQPLASPLFGDLAGLPPILLQVGTAELLLNDALEFAAQAELGGIHLTLEVWSEMVHVWHLFAPRVPESAAAVARIGEYLSTQFDKASSGDTANNARVPRAPDSTRVGAP